MRNRFKNALCALVILSQFFWVFLPLADPNQVIGQTRRRPPSQVNNMNTGLQFKLSEGSPASGRAETVPTAPASQLSDADLQAVIARLQPIKADPTDEKEFALRDRSLPPPRTGRTVQATFPPPEVKTAPDVATGPLEVVRFLPEGDVPIAPQLSVTFSQPMVAVTSHADTVAQGVPVRLTPQPPGQWRWIGTKTLLFEPGERFPMATEYRVEIPAGTKSATGATLAAARSWRFATPPPTVKSSYPTNGPTRRDPVMFVEFDQAIDQEAVLESIHVRAGRTEWKTRLATNEEILADPAVSRLVLGAQKGRWLAFRPADQLPADAAVDVSVGPGTPSAEGPIKTRAAQSLSFRTYGPLRVTEHRCGWQENCSPFDQWTINFTNPLDAEAFDKSQVKVEPEIQGMKASVYGNTLVITGIKKGRT
ncbi:MAG TPA: Ig-like domain-containing protein, partial [Blastocatellia bacterium]